MIKLWQQLFSERKKMMLLLAIFFLALELVAFYQIKQHNLEPLVMFIYIWLVIVPLCYLFIFENSRISKFWNNPRFRLLDLKPIQLLLGNIGFGVISFLFWTLFLLFTWSLLGVLGGIISWPAADAIGLFIFYAFEMFVSITLFIQGMSLVFKAINEHWPYRGKFLAKIIFLAFVLFFIIYLPATMLPENSVSLEMSQDSFQMAMQFPWSSFFTTLVTDWIQIIIFAVMSYFCLERFYEARSKVV